MNVRLPSDRRIDFEDAQRIFFGDFSLTAVPIENGSNENRLIVIGQIVFYRTYFMSIINTKKSGFTSSNAQTSHTTGD